jgi:6-phosphogluconolactonase
MPMSSIVVEQNFESRDEASHAAAEQLIAMLAANLSENARAAMIVTGGSSPVQCYAQMAKADVEWSRVQLVLSDERWVAPSDENSNEGMIRSSLMVDQAANARLMPFYNGAVPASERCEELNISLGSMSQPFAATLLGMGEDGHIASLFPDMENLADGLDPDSKEQCITVQTAASSLPRVSLTLAPILHSEQVVLLFFGEAKRAVYEKAKSSPGLFPVSSLLTQQRTPVHVFWAP